MMAGGHLQIIKIPTPRAPPPRNTPGIAQNAPNPGTVPWCSARVGGDPGTVPWCSARVGGDPGTVPWRSARVGGVLGNARGDPGTAPDITARNTDTPAIEPHSIHRNTAVPASAELINACIVSGCMMRSTFHLRHLGACGPVRAMVVRIAAPVQAKMPSPLLTQPLPTMSLYLAHEAVASTKLEVGLDGFQLTCTCCRPFRHRGYCWRPPPRLLLGACRHLTHTAGYVCCTNLPANLQWSLFAMWCMNRSFSWMALSESM
jgi:hypothetical protein